MSPAVALTTFVVIFPAELPDKTALAAVLLGARYRPAWVLAGVCAAFAAHVVLAVAVGSAVALLPHRAVAAVVAALFAVGAVLLLRFRPEAAEEEAEEEAADVRAPATAGFWRVAGGAGAVIFVAEFGDLTQVATATLASRYADPLAVGVGALAALCAVAALAVFGGRALLRVLPLLWVTRIAAAVMAVLAVVSLVSALR